MGREDCRCEDGQMISRTGQTDQWQSAQGWRETGSNGELLVHEMVSDPQQRGRKQASKHTWGAHWRHMANTTEPSMRGGYAAVRQITLTTCLL